jgi:uncharacterized peroxidase-related enzyme
MTTFAVPARSEVNETNQAIFDGLKSQLGFVPNLYATFGLSNTGLANYMALQSGKTSLTNKEKEIVNLVVSQYNDCKYCQAAHTTLGKMNGFNDDEIIEIRKGSASFNPNYHALAQFVLSVVSNKGKVEATALDAFLEAGYNNGSVVDVVIQIGDKIMANYLHNITQVAIDFPLAPAL